jgi:hypothetical protein
VRRADVRPSPRGRTGYWRCTGDCAENTVSLQHCRRVFSPQRAAGCASFRVPRDYQNMGDAGGTLVHTAVASGAGRVVKSGCRTGGACLGSRGFRARSATDKPHGEQHLEQRAGLRERSEGRVVEERCRMAVDSPVAYGVSVRRPWSSDPGRFGTGVSTQQTRTRSKLCKSGRMSASLLWRSTVIGCDWADGASD